MEDIKNTGPWSFTKDSVWSEDKNNGPFDFTEQEDKWGYLNNPNWSPQADAQEFCENVGLSLNPSIHKPCGHWHKQKYPIYGYCPTGKWIAAKDQPGQPYIYLYDTGYYAVVQIDTSISGCPLIGQLVINESGWDLGWGRLGSAAQRGGCCMSKDGKTLWYLFEGVNGNDGDCKMVEVNIENGEMSITKTTIFSSLIATDTFINDGCTNDTYTFWCTNELTGRIIKIRNSDHALIENHDFGYTDSIESIPSLDVHKSRSRLYWSRVGNCGGIPLCNAYAYHYEGDLDFNVLNSVSWYGMGSGTPQFQNWVRVFGSDIYFDRFYFTTSGYLRRRDPGFINSVGRSYIAPYNHNILNVKDGMVYCLHGDGSVSNVTYLSAIKYFDMTLDHRTDVKYYAGTGYLLSYPWATTYTSAMNNQTQIIMMFRYEVDGVVGNQGTGYQTGNWGAAFNTDFELLSDTFYNQIILNPKYNIRDEEPQVWPLAISNWQNTVDHWDES